MSALYGEIFISEIGKGVIGVKKDCIFSCLFYISIDFNGWLGVSSPSPRHRVAHQEVPISLYGPMPLI